MNLICNGDTKGVVAYVVSTNETLPQTSVTILNCSSNTFTVNANSTNSISVIALSGSTTKITFESRNEEGSSQFSPIYIVIIVLGGLLIVFVGVIIC